MKLSRKTRTIISACFHLALYGNAVYLFNNEYKNIAFYMVCFFNLINWVAAISNYNFYLMMKKLNDQSNKISDELIVSCGKFSKAVSSRDSLIKSYRAHVVIAQDKHDELLDMNNRLHAINMNLKTQIQTLQYGGK